VISKVAEGVSLPEISEVLAGSGVTGLVAVGRLVTVTVGNGVEVGELGALQASTVAIRRMIVPI